MSINIRIASENEFIKCKKTIVVDKKERKLFLNDVWYKLNNDSWLKWRFQKVQEVLVGKYDNDDQKSIIQLIRYSQFDPIELKQRK